MGALTSKGLDVIRLAAGRKESKIQYCGTLPMPASALYY